MPEELNIDWSQLPDKGEGIDWSKLPDKEEEPLELRQAPPLTFWQKAKDIFREDPAKLRAKAQNALQMSEMFNISPSQAYKYHDEITKQLGGEKITTPELLGGLIMGPVAMGLMAHPIGTIFGIAAFEIVSEAESLAISLVKKEEYKAFQKKGLVDLLPEDAGQITEDIVDTLDFLGKAMLAKGVFSKTPKLAESLTKRIITEHNLPKTIYIDPKELKTELQRGGVIAADEMQIIKELGLKGSEYRRAVKDGLHIEIPAEKVAILSDRPWFAKVKSLFKVDPTQRRIITKEGEVTYKFGKVEKVAPEVAKKAPTIEEVPKEVGEAPAPKEIPNFTKITEAKLSEGKRTDYTAETYKWAKDATKEEYEALKKEYAGERKRLAKLSEELGKLPKGPERGKLAEAKGPRAFENSFKGEAIEAYEMIHGLRKIDADKKAGIEKTLGMKFSEIKAKAELEEVPFEVPGIEERLPEIPPDFAEQAQGYLAALEDMVELGEPGKRIKTVDYDGTEKWVGYESTYPDFMRNKGWTKKEVLGAFKKQSEGKKLTPHQENIVEAALDEAQEMFLRDAESFGYPPEYIEQAEASIDAAIDKLLKVPREVEQPTALTARVKKHLAAIRKALKPKKIKAKKLIRETTGQVKISALVREEEALNAAMKKAAQAARKAFSEGKKEALSKERVRIQALKVKARERAELREAIKKMVKDLKGIDTTKMSPQEAEPINDLLKGLDLVKRQKPTILKLTKTRDYLQDNPEAEVPDYMMDRLKILDQKNLNDITFDELESVHTAVMHYAHLNKLKNKIKVGREKKRATKAIADSIGEMKPLKGIQDKIISSQGGRGKRNKSLIKDTFGIRHDHYDLIVESLAGPNSTMDKILYHEVKSGKIKELKYRQDVNAKFQADFVAEGFKIKDSSKWIKQKVKTGKFELTRGERMALYRHSLNEDNRRAILEGGFGFRLSDKPNEVYRMTEDEMNQILDTLTADEKIFAGKPVDNLFEAQYDALNDIFYQKNGYPLPKEEIYYPKETMPLARGLDIEKESALELFKGRWTRIGLEKGMLEKRKRVQLPIYLNSLAYDINKSVMKSAAYVGLELPLSNASKLLYNKDFRRELSTRYGEITWKEIEKGLRDIAGDYQSYSTVEELLMKAKNNLATAFLGLNPFVMGKQIISLPIYLKYVKSEYLIQGSIDFVNHPDDISKRHKLYSPEYLERVEGGFSRDVADVFKAGAEKRIYAGKPSIKESVMGGIKLFDKGAIIPGMQGAVLQVLDELKAGKLSDEVKIALDFDLEGVDISKLTPEEKMRLAYKYADYATERTQPMFSPEHRSSLSRGSTIEKLATMFGSFTNQALNLTRRTWRNARDTNDPRGYAKFVQVLSLIFVANTAGVMAIDEIRDRVYKRKRDRSLVGRVLDVWSGYMFFVRDLASSVISKVERGTFLGYDVELPIARVPELLSDCIANGTNMLIEKNPRKREKAAKRFIDDAINLLLTIHGVPYETPKRIGKAITERID